MNLTQKSRIQIEPFQHIQAETVAALIRKNIQEVHNQDYPQDFIDMLLDSYNAEALIKKSEEQHIIIASLAAEIIGTAGLANFGTAEQPKYYAVAVFVLPEYHGQGIGKRLMATIEEKACCLGAKKVIVRAAVNAKGFYLRLGYQYVDGIDEPNELGQYLMEKIMFSDIQTIK